VAALRSGGALSSRGPADRATSLHAEGRATVGRKNFHKIVKTVVFLAGALAIAVLTVVTAGRQALSGAFLLYVSLAAHFLYVLSSAVLASTDTRPSSVQWAKSYTISMLPFVVLTSWLPITAAWLVVLPPTFPVDAREILCILNNAILAFACGLLLSWMFHKWKGSAILKRIALPAVGALFPIALWLVQIVAVLSYTKVL
jgi:hypothetical protein